MSDKDTTMEKIISLCKRRGFVYPGSEIYGGLSGTWDYGPLGVALKNNIKSLWWKQFVDSRTDMYGVDAAIIMNPKVWEASGHTETFTDPLVECSECKRRFREDHLDDPKVCPECKGSLGAPRAFNMMFETYVGATQSEEDKAYLRPETAQGMFVNFKNVRDSFSPKMPFGLAQVGKAFRNEIAPRDFVFRSREFEQMEIEYFVKEDEWEDRFEAWRKEMHTWMENLGLNMDKVHELEVPENDLAHYSKRTIDFEYDFPFGKSELYGLAYRTDFDLKNHQEASGVSQEYITETGERYIPHCIEPTFGLDRTVLAVLADSYREEEMDGEVRAYLALSPKIAPRIVAVSPLLKNKPELVEKAEEVFGILKGEFGRVVYDDNGNIGKRYRRQDEVGTPFCVTIDFDTLPQGDVTVRDRDTGKQERVAITELVNYIQEKIK